MATPKKRRGFSPVAIERGEDFNALRPEYLKIRRLLSENGILIKEIPEAMLQTYSDKHEYAREQFHAYENWISKHPQIKKGRYKRVKAKMHRLGTVYERNGPRSEEVPYKRIDGRRRRMGAF